MTMARSTAPGPTALMASGFIRKTWDSIGRTCGPGRSPTSVTTSCWRSAVPHRSLSPLGPAPYSIRPQADFCLQTYTRMDRHRAGTIPPVRLLPVAVLQTGVLIRVAVGQLPTVSATATGQLPNSDPVARPTPAQMAVSGGDPGATDHPNITPSVLRAAGQRGQRRAVSKVDTRPIDPDEPVLSTRHPQPGGLTTATVGIKTKVVVSDPDLPVTSLECGSSS